MFNENDVRLCETLAALDDALNDEGFTYNAAERHVHELVSHASMARARADAPPGAFRDFVARAGWMTRTSRVMDDMRNVVASEPLRLAACVALHDLIMEGV